jgi:hypothetical protein
MNETTTETIKEIAEQLDCGFRAFVHKTTGKLLFVPNESEFQIDSEGWDEELELLANNFTDYYEIEKWTSGEAFEVMVGFTEQSTNKQLQGRLISALNMKKPFREFKFVIENSGDFRQQWFDFKNKWQYDFVERQLARLKQADA